MCHISVADSQDKKQPKDINRLQTREKCKSNVLRNPALVLLCFPVEFKGPNRGKFGKNGPENAEVDVMAKIDPDGGKKGIKGTNDG